MGKVISVSPTTCESTSYILTIRSRNMQLQPGDLVAVNGVCLTVQKVDEYEFTVNLWQQTIEKTNLGLVDPGDRVNLEFNRHNGEDYLDINCKA